MFHANVSCPRAWVSFLRLAAQHFFPLNGPQVHNPTSGEWWQLKIDVALLAGHVTPEIPHWGFSDTPLGVVCGFPKKKKDIQKRHSKKRGLPSYTKTNRIHWVEKHLATRLVLPYTYALIQIPTQNSGGKVWWDDSWPLIFPQSRFYIPHKERRLRQSERGSCGARTGKWCEEEA